MVEQDKSAPPHPAGPDFVGLTPNHQELALARGLCAAHAAVVARRGAEPALIQGDVQLNHRQLHEQALICAAWLRGRGVAAGDRVAYLGLSRIEQVVLLFGVAAVGAILVPLNHRLSPAEWAAVLDDCAPVLLIHDEAWAEAAAGVAAQGGAHPALPTCALGDWTSPCASDGSPEPTLDEVAARAALIVYTSGTTGLPKGAVHTQANLLANAAIACQVQELVETDRVLSVLPLFHVGGLCIQTLPALLAGACVHLLERFEPGATLAVIRAWRPTLTLQVPATLVALARHADWAGTDLTCLRAVWAGSSLIPDEAIEPLHARGIALCNVYGSTETGPFSLALPARRAVTHQGSCGWPAPGVQARLEPTGADDGVGEVWLRAPNIARCYWPDKPVCDQQGWFHTGDLARVDAQGCHTIVGRCKDMVISGGENIYPAEVERAAMAFDGVQECVAFGIPDTRWGEALVLVVVAQPGVAWTDDVLMRFLGDRLARYKLPRQVQRVDALPKTALGKVQKHLLRQSLAKAS